MDPITIALIAFAGWKLLGKSKTEQDQDSETGTSATSKPNLPGAPTLEIDKIHKFPFDKVDFILSAGGDEEKGDHPARSQKPTIVKAGGYTAIAITDPKIRPGQKKPDIIVIAVKDAAGKTVIGKRIYVNDKQILDLGV